MRKAYRGKHAAPDTKASGISSSAMSIVDSGLRNVVAASALSLALLSGFTMDPSKEAFAASVDDSAEDAKAVESVLASHIAESASSGSSVSKTAEFVSSAAEELDTFAADYVSTARTNALMDLAQSKLGCAYVSGGMGPNSFDCSGFTKYCFQNALGIELPRTAAAQSELGESVSLDELQAGDLLCWGSGRGVYHVGIYVGDGQYIHAAGSGKGVKMETMQYYCPSFAKRLF